MYLQTQRIIVRPLCQNDLQEYHKLFSNPENLTFEIIEPHSPQRSEAELTYWLERNLELDSAFGTTEFGIELISTGKLIGVISGLYIDTNSAIIEMGIIVDHIYSKNGYSHEALQAYINFAFSQTDTHKILARTDSRNIPCIRLLEKIGMTREGLLRKNVKMLDGQYYDEAIYGVLKEDFHLLGSA
jgi:[ribosomal protein S5]-alanine N-acetyltransferase